MTKEQLLVYIWSIYPEGGAKDFWVVLLILYLAFIIVIYFAYLLNTAEEGSDEEREDDKDDKKERPLFIRLGKWKVSGILFLLFMIFLCNLVPKKRTLHIYCRYTICYRIWKNYIGISTRSK